MPSRLLSLDPAASRARRYLLPHEHLVAVARRHPVWLARPVAVALGATVLGGWLASVLDAPTVLGVVLVAALGYVGWHVLDWSHERVVVTDRRLIRVTGLFTRRVAVMPLRKVTDMTYERPLAGRLLGDWGWGTFVMESAGQDQSLHRIAYLPRPEELYARVCEEIFGEAGLYGRQAASLSADDYPPLPARRATRRGGAARTGQDTEEIPVVRDSPGGPVG